MTTEKVKPKDLDLAWKVQLLDLGVKNLAAFCKTLHERIEKLEASE